MQKIENQIKKPKKKKPKKIIVKMNKPIKTMNKEEEEEEKDEIREDIKANSMKNRMEEEEWSASEENELYIEEIEDAMDDQAEDTMNEEAQVESIVSQYYQKINSGDIEALNALASLYELGDSGVKKNFKKAFHLYKNYFDKTGHLETLKKIG
jgi:hypothetical protein